MNQHGNWRDRLRQQLGNIPFRHWKAGVFQYLKSTPWQLWGFALVATFGFIVYLWLAFWFGIFGFLVIGVLSLMFHVERDASAKQGGILYWIERSFSEIIFKNLPQRQRARLAKAGRRFGPFGFVRLLLDVAIVLARPNRFTFVLGIVAAALLTFNTAQHHFFPRTPHPSGYSRQAPQQPTFPSQRSAPTSPRTPFDYD